MYDVSSFYLSKIPSLRLQQIPTKSTKFVLPNIHCSIAFFFSLYGVLIQRQTLFYSATTLLSCHSSNGFERKAVQCLEIKLNRDTEQYTSWRGQQKRRLVSACEFSQGLSLGLQRSVVVPGPERQDRSFCCSKHQTLF